MTDLRDPVLAAVTAEGSLPRAGARGRTFVLLVLSGAVSVLVFLVTSRILPHGGPFALFAATSLGALAIAAGAHRHRQTKRPNEPRRRDELAFAELYDAIAPPIRWLANRAIRDPALAEDVVRQTFLHMHRCRGTFVTGSEVLPWAKSIARRLVLDALRRRARRRPPQANPDESPSGRIGRVGLCGGDASFDPGGLRGASSGPEGRAGASRQRP